MEFQTAARRTASGKRVSYGVRAWVKKAVARCAPRGAHRDSFILCYHDITPTGAARWHPWYSTSPDRLAQQLDALQAHFEFSSLSDIVLERSWRGRPRLAITADDGFATVRTHLLPELQRRSAPLTLFVNERAAREDWLPFSAAVVIRTSQERSAAVLRLAQGRSPGPWNSAAILGDDLHEWLSRNPDVAREYGREPGTYLSVAELRDLARQPDVELGSHGRSHVRLISVTDETLTAEIAENRIFVASVSQHPSPYFAIPYGKTSDFDARLYRVARDAGHLGVLTVSGDSVRATTVVDEVLCVPRVGVADQVPDELLFQLLRTGWRNRL